MPARYSGSTGHALLAFFLLVLTGCQSGPPVQEMSDARQAIAVARDAGAADIAPDKLRAAEAYLNSAQQYLTNRSYSQARSDAVQAKNKALDALASTASASPRETQ